MLINSIPSVSILIYKTYDKIRLGPFIMQFNIKHYYTQHYTEKMYNIYQTLNSQKNLHTIVNI